VGGVQIPDAVDTVVCAPDDGWKYHPKHVEQFTDINKLCNFASCWTYIGILIGAPHILHISRIRVNRRKPPSSYLSQCPLSNKISSSLNHSKSESCVTAVSQPASPSCCRAPLEARDQIHFYFLVSIP
jgi:hypothetical protein